MNNWRDARSLPRPLLAHPSSPSQAPGGIPTPSIRYFRGRRMPFLFKNATLSITFGNEKNRPGSGLCSAERLFLQICLSTSSFASCFCCSEHVIFGEKMLPHFLHVWTSTCTHQPARGRPLQCCRTASRTGVRPPGGLSPGKFWPKKGQKLVFGRSTGPILAQNGTFWIFDDVM